MTKAFLGLLVAFAARTCVAATCQSTVGQWKAVDVEPAPISAWTTIEIRGAKGKSLEISSLMNGEYSISSEGGKCKALCSKMEVVLIAKHPVYGRHRKNGIDLKRFNFKSKSIYSIKLPDACMQNKIGVLEYLADDDVLLTEQNGGAVIFQRKKAPAVGKK